MLTALMFRLLVVIEDETEKAEIYSSPAEEKSSRFSEG